MDRQDNLMTEKLLELMHRTGCPIVQRNGQRRFGPPPELTNAPPPPRGCEVFIGKLPRDIYEDELVPIFATVGTIYEMRLMMDFSGSNRGYAFVMYTTRAEANAAVKQLDGYEIRPRRHIGVVKSVDNCRLFIGNIPKSKTKQELEQELTKLVTGLVRVIMYKNMYNRNVNRGFAFAEFTSHKAAAMARRELVPGYFKLWNQNVVVDWAEPEPIVDDEKMNRVKVLHVRNLAFSTTPQTIQNIFQKAIQQKIERVKKIYDYAFVHFYKREHAEMAMSKLQDSDIEGCQVEICWAKPVDRELYRIQKLKRGNSKFNKTSNTLNLAETLTLYKQHLNRKEYENGPEDEGFCSANAGNSPSDSPKHFKPVYYGSTYEESLSMAPAKLESICSSCFWMQPVYKYQKYVDINRVQFWVCTVDLPCVALPLLTTPRRIGPLSSRPCYTIHEAYVEAAGVALQTLKMLRSNSIQQSLPPPPPLYTPMPAVQNCLRLPLDYPSMYQTPPIMPMTMPSMWRTA